MMLRERGFQLDTAENGREAVEKVASSEPGYYNFILMDIQMPEMDGYDATRAIRSLDDGRLAGIPIIVMTANAFKKDVEAARKAGMDGHIAKPLDVNAMFDTIENALKDSKK